MSGKDNYNVRLVAAKAMKKEEIKNPSMPVDDFIQEAEDLVSNAKIDRQALITANIPANFVEETTISIEALRQAESIWLKDVKVKSEAAEKWKVKSPEAFDFRDGLLHAFRFAFRNDSKNLDVVAEITKGYSNADMIQDLSDLATLGKANTAALEAIKFDLSLLDKAENLSVELGKILGDANGERFNTAEEKLIRDAMYTILKNQVTEIRACGKYVFWKDPEKLKNYSSKYYRKMRKNKDKNDSNSGKTE